MKGYWKIPGRDVYCQGLQIWCAEMILIYVVYKLAPPVLPRLGV